MFTQPPGSRPRKAGALRANVSPNPAGPAYAALGDLLQWVAELLDVFTSKVHSFTAVNMLYRNKNNSIY
jgi:hypothetical protein